MGARSRYGQGKSVIRIYHLRRIIACVRNEQIIRRGVGVGVRHGGAAGDEIGWTMIIAVSDVSSFEGYVAVVLGDSNMGRSPRGEACGWRDPEGKTAP